MSDSFGGLNPSAFDASNERDGRLIRPLHTTDRREWTRLWTAYLKFYETSLPERQFDLTFARFLNPAEPMFAYIADVNGQPKGLVHIILHRSGWALNASCYLQDLYVDPDTRGTHLGRALIEHVYEVVKAAGGTQVHWLTHESNATARRLYDRIAANQGFLQYVKAL